MNGLTSLERQKLVAAGLISYPPPVVTFPRNIRKTGSVSHPREKTKTTPENEALRTALKPYKAVSKKNPFSYGRIGRECGMADNVLQRFMSGEISNPRPENVRKLRAWLDGRKTI